MWGDDFKTIHTCIRHAKNISFNHAAINIGGSVVRSYAGVYWKCLIEIRGVIVSDTGQKPTCSFGKWLNILSFIFLFTTRECKSSLVVSHSTDLKFNQGSCNSFYLQQKSFSSNNGSLPRKNVEITFWFLPGISHSLSLLLYNLPTSIPNEFGLIIF